MRARRIGRALGIGARVAARVATGRAAGQQRAASPLTTAWRVQAHPTAPDANPQRGNEAAGQASARATVPTGQSVSRGIRGLLQPLRRVGGILWLEVTGVFFLLPVAVFAPALWRDLAAYRHMSDHKRLWVTAAVMAVFLYLGVSSFWRARKRAMQS